MSRIKLLIFTSIAVVLAAISFAQTYISIDEHIVSFQSLTTINKDGTIDVTENIAYDFGPNQRHGIYRDIPYIKTNSGGKKFRIEIKNIKVGGDAYSTSLIGDKLRIQIGDPQKLITGRKDYTISYKVYGALTYFSDHDELYWNLTGNEWTIPINQYVGKITIPTGTDTKNINAVCYTGAKGSTDKNCDISTETKDGITTVDISTRGLLDVGEGITAVVGFPKGLVTVLEPKPYFNPVIFVFIAFGIGALLSYYLFFVIIKKWWQDKQNTDKKARIVAAWFEAPKFSDGRVFTPAETAGIVNKKIDHRSLSGTLIQLAQKGFLKIKVEENKNVTFMKTKEWQNDKDLSDYEVQILNDVFSNGSLAEVTDKSLKTSTTFSEKIHKAPRDAMKYLYKQGMFIDDPVKYQDLLSGLLPIASILVTIFPPFILLPVVIIGWSLKTKSTRRTDLGIEKYSEAQSLLNFLKSQDEQLNFQSKNQMFFEKLLPYATAFGVEKIWAKRFEGLEFTKNDWYDGPNTNSMLYVASLNHMTTSFHAITTTTSSTGFSSGFSGGSSGGGGGGGGGGSW